MRINAKEPGSDYDSWTRNSRSRWVHLLGSYICTVCKEGGGMKTWKMDSQRLKRIWKSKNILRRTELRLYKTLVVPVLVLLYRCETWKVNKQNDRAVDMFHNKCLQRILQIQCQNHINTEELLERAHVKPMNKEVKQRGWNMIGHRLRQDQSSDCYTVHSNNLGTRRKKKKRKTKNHLEANGRKRKSRSRMAVLKGSEDHCS